MPSALPLRGRAAWNPKRPCSVFRLETCWCFALKHLGAGKFPMAAANCPHRLTACLPDLTDCLPPPWGARRLPLAVVCCRAGREDTDD